MILNLYDHDEIEASLVHTVYNKISHSNVELLTAFEIGNSTNDTLH